MYMSFESPEGKLSKSYFFIFFPNVFLELQAYIFRTNKHDYGFVSHCILYLTINGHVSTKNRDYVIQTTAALSHETNTYC